MNEAYTRRQTFVDLFAGIGGIALGLERAGMRCVGHVEIDEMARGVLRYHRPGAHIIEDVHNVTATTFPRFDGLVGGFPCQGISRAGTRAGLADARSGLWWQFHRIIAVYAPRWVLIENVPELLTNKKGRDFAAMLDGLRELGYCVAWRVLDAQFFGLAQRRKRVFVVASLGAGPIRTGQVLLEPEGCEGHPAPRRQAPEDVATPLGAGADGSGWRNDFERAGAFIPSIAATLTAGSKEAANAPGRRREDDDNLVVSEALRAGTNSREGHVVVANTLTASNGHHGYSSPRGDGADNLVVSAVVHCDCGHTERVRGLESEIDRHPCTQCGAFGGRVCYDPPVGVGCVDEPFPNTHVVLPDVARCLTSRNERIDAETETLLPVVFDETQITSPENRSNPQPGAPCHTLAARGRAPLVASPITAHEGRTYDHAGKGAGGGHNLIVGSFQQSSMDGKGTLGWNDGDGVGRPVKPQADHQMLVTAEPAMPIQSANQIERGQNGVGVGSADDPMFTLTARDQHAVFRVGVRRLMPLECERLQGFPDNYTAQRVGKNGEVEAQSDAARYRQIGNSVPIPTVEWIGRRIDRLLPPPEHDVTHQPTSITCISLWQPWATLIALGRKQMETRSWSTPFRGVIAIHAAKRWTRRQQAFLNVEPFKSALAGVELQFGGFVATAELVDVVRCRDARPSEEERAFGDFTPGRFAWLLANVKPVEFVPARGRQSMWSVPFPLQREA